MFLAYGACMDSMRISFAILADSCGADREIEIATRAAMDAIIVDQICTLALRIDTLFNNSFKH
jgi:hypothetical protein